MTANDLMFHKMQTKDIPFVAELEKRFFSTPWNETALEKGLQNGTEIFWLAQKDGGDVGYIGYVQSFETADILTVCIDPVHRRKGYAEALLTFCLEQMRQSGVEKVFLEVRESNAAARSLYEKSGFEYLNKRINYYKNPTEDGLVMMKEMV